LILTFRASLLAGRLDDLHAQLNRSCASTRGSGDEVAGCQPSTQAQRSNQTPEDFPRIGAASPDRTTATEAVVSPPPLRLTADTTSRLGWALNTATRGLLLQLQSPLAPTLVVPSAAAAVSGIGAAGDPEPPRGALHTQLRTWVAGPS